MENFLNVLKINFIDDSRYLYLVRGLTNTLVITIFATIIGVIIGFDAKTNFIIALGIILANCPEGLLITITACLMITAKKMLKKNLLVKNKQGLKNLFKIYSSNIDFGRKQNSMTKSINKNI